MPVLSLKHITKSFGAIHALTDINLDLEAGEVLGLMGDNGAGKSTLVRIIAGNFPPTSGEILLDGKPVHFHKPVEARAAGIEVSSTKTSPSATIWSAASNVFLGREASWRFGPFKFLSSSKMSERAGTLFGELKSETRPHDLVRRMSGGQRQAVAIARTRLSEAKIVLMDEPTAAISVRQVAQVLDLIRRLRDQGIAIVLISHRMPDVFTVADRVAGAASRTQGGREGDLAVEPRGSNWPDYRSDPACLTQPPNTKGRRSATSASRTWWASRR